MSNDTSGQAFPSQKWEWDDSTHEYQPSGAEPGMTLRDYFAAKAMQGVIASEGPSFAPHIRSLRAEDAYAMADAMLTARSKP